MTFAGLKQGDREEARKEEEENTKGGEAMEFTEEDLSLEWLRMCNRMPPSMVVPYKGIFLLPHSNIGQQK